VVVVVGGGDGWLSNKLNKVDTQAPVAAPFPSASPTGNPPDPTHPPAHLQPVSVKAVTVHLPLPQPRHLKGGRLVGGDPPPFLDRKRDLQAAAPQLQHAHQRVRGLDGLDASGQLLAPQFGLLLLLDERLWGMVFFWG